MKFADSGKAQESARDHRIQIVAEIRKIRHGASLQRLAIRQLVDEDRRWQLQSATGLASYLSSKDLP
jgi:hypothetical protein